MRIALMSLLNEHRRDGALPTSVRFLFYELVARSIIAKEGKRPDKEGARGRREGSILFRMIGDGGGDYYVHSTSKGCELSRQWRPATC